ncbi:type II secretion system protein [uncultured Campylobacter sp.]|uniref:pilus assembly FimT family protein n=1 Tax=uncultured Campylobacter sp. TaxID=218934 RepID=UPI00263084DD|nr:type II secretion system protein [uncultured Campylobacter sp.]
MKKAFTMIELIFIIVVVGILAAVAVPQINRNSLVEAADQITAHIRYTQQLAMNDNKFNANDPDWFRRLWRIQFTNQGAPGSAAGWRYNVYWDNGAFPGSNGQPNSLASIAADPQNPNKLLTSGFARQPANTNSARMNKKLNLGGSYDIVDVDFGAACNQGGNATIAFDSKGRPMRQVANVPLYANLITAPCTITLTNSANEHAIITIQPETGYVNYTLASNTGPGGQ